MFSVFGSRKGVPRWGFSADWNEYVTVVKAELTRRAVPFTTADLREGVIPLAEPASYEAWDLRAITARCRDLEPRDWSSALRASLDEAIGAPLVPVVARQVVPPRAPRKASDRDPPLDRSQVRVQLFSHTFAGLISDRTARRPIGDAALVLVADLGGSEETLTWDDVEDLGLSREAAFQLGHDNAAAQMTEAIRVLSGSISGATTEVLVANGFFMAGALLELRRQAPVGRPLVVTPISWHHWVVFELQAGAKRETLVEMRRFVDQIADGITTIHSAAAWVTRSLWWWPTGDDEPIVIDEAAPPPELAAQLGVVDSR